MKQEEAAAENCEKYLAKGRLVGVEGSIQTGSYDKPDGTRIFTTSVVANRVEFLEWGNKNKRENNTSIPESFEELDEDVPF